MRNVAQTAFWMAVLTLISKLFGFVREMVLANYFGTSYVTDAYVMAIAIPGIVFGGILASVAIAYMPMLSKITELEGKAKANEFTSGVLKILTIVSIVSAIIGILISDQMVAIFASGFEGETATLTSFFLKITFSYIIFSATADILEAFLRYKGVFLPQVAFGFILNIVLISTIIISALTSYYYLAFGYLIAYFIKLTVMLLISKKKQFNYISTARVNKTVKSLIALALPVFIGSGVNQINAFVDKTLASGLPVGSVSALNYGNLLIGMITGLTITIMTTIIYPKITQASAQGDSERLSGIVSLGMILIVMIALPCSLGAMIYSEQIVQIVYERGAFGAGATNLTSSAFFYYAIGLLFTSVNTLLIQVYYSKHNMKTPVIFGAIGVIINIVLSLILIQPMAHNGLALATSISTSCGTIMLLLGLKKVYPEIEVLNNYQKLLKITFAAIASVGISYFVYETAIMAVSHIIVARVVQLTLAVLVAGVVYLGLLVILKLDEVKIIKMIIK